MERKIKLGVSPAGIVSVVFGILGAIYLVLGLCLSYFPEDVEDTTAGFVFAVLGGVFLVAAIVIFCFVLTYRQYIQRIYDSGKYVLGEVADIIANYNVRVNNRNPYVVMVRYADRHGNIHIFRSGNQRAYPDRSIIGKQVKVYYEDESFKKYYVDLEGVIPKVIEH